MASNLRSSQRAAPKKKDEDFIYASKNNDKPRFPCKGCENVFKKKKVMLLHQAQCMKLKVDLSKPAPFPGNTPEKCKQNSNSPVDKDKFEPLSQPTRSPNAPTTYAAAVVSCPAPGNPVDADGTPTPAIVEVDLLQEQEIRIETSLPIEEISFMDPIIHPNLPD